MCNKFRMNTLHCLKVARQFTLIREVFYDKGLGSQNNKLLITAFVYNYVILKHSVLFVLDLKQMAILHFFNCFYGDNRYVDDWRILTAIELCLSSEFCSKHPSFISLISKHSKVLSSIEGERGSVVFSGGQEMKIFSTVF